MSIHRSTHVYITLKIKVKKNKKWDKEVTLHSQVWAVLFRNGRYSQ